MKNLHKLLCEVATAKSPADKEFVALHKVDKKQFTKEPDTQFKGGTKKDESKMAHASDETGMETDVAKEKPVHEEITEEQYKALSEEEQALYEISKKTLGSYITKATKRAVNGTEVATHRARDASEIGAKDFQASDRKYDESRAMRDKVSKRLRGVQTAIKKLTKEEFEALTFEEQVDYNLQEISKKALGSYIKKASNDIGFSMHDHGAQTVQYVQATKGSEDSKRADAARTKSRAHAVKRANGIEKATDRLVKEGKTYTSFTSALKKPAEEE